MIVKHLMSILSPFPTFYFNTFLAHFFSSFSLTRWAFEMKTQMLEFDQGLIWSTSSPIICRL